MRSAKGTMLLLAALLVGVAGCQKLNFSTTVTLGPNQIHDMEVPPPAYNQRLTVTIAPTSGAASAYVVKQSDYDKVMSALKKNTEPDAAMLLGSRVSRGIAQEYTFEANVPAKTAYYVLVKADVKMTDVKVTIVGR